jgi:two-component system, LytTR family, response regulator LytT
MNMSNSMISPSKTNAPLTQEKKTQISFSIKVHNKRYFVTVDSIVLAYLEGVKVYLLDFKGDMHTIFKTLESLEEAMPAQQFYRINRQMIVNRQAIADVERYANQRLVVHLSVPTPQQIIVPRLKVRHFMDWIERG